MHATASLLQDGTTLLIGGRLSPMRLCTQMLAMKLNSGISDLEHLFQSLKVEQNENILKTKHKHGGQKHKSQIRAENCMERQENSNSENCEEKIREKEVNYSNLDNITVDKVEAACDNSSDCDTHNLNGAQKTVGERENMCQDSSTESRLEEDKVFDIQDENAHVKPSLSEKVPLDGSSTAKADNTDVLVDCCVLKQEGELPCPRWRHSAITVQQNGECIHCLVTVLNSVPLDYNI